MMTMRLIALSGLGFTPSEGAGCASFFGFLEIQELRTAIPG